MKFGFMDVIFCYFFRIQPRLQAKQLKLYSDEEKKKSSKLDDLPQH